jgi:hypothetical protein
VSPPRSPASLPTAPDLTGSRASDVGPFTDPDGFVWESHRSESDGAAAPSAHRPRPEAPHLRPDHGQLAAGSLRLRHRESEVALTLRGGRSFAVVSLARSWWWRCGLRWHSTMERVWLTV